MAEEKRPKRRRLWIGNLGKMATPPLTTPQWKDAVKEQEQRGPKKRKTD